MNWKVGDSFVIIDPEKDFLDGDMKNYVFTVESLKYDDKYNGKQGMEGNFLWFRSYGGQYGCNYVNKNNIRKATKLEKVLK